MRDVSNNPGVDTFHCAIDELTLSEQMRLFFATGIDTVTLQKNMQVLLNTLCAQSTDAVPCLVHMLLPSYFADLREFKGRSVIEQEIYLFLKESALFYQELYRSLDAQRSLKIYIVIPPLYYFMQMIEEGSLSKIEANLTVLNSELIATCTPRDLLFMDQHIDELNQMVRTLHGKGIKNVRGVGLPITNSFGRHTTIFTPYLLRPEKDARVRQKPRPEELRDNSGYQSSIVLTTRLIEYIRTQIAGKVSA